ncbi:hypothetical protein DFH09DRAFT_1089993 [Mycena vulgaris]|nr:hypothetical protein DFH09DRAFT_1089993 [Mycena vulgaris]
MLEIGMYVEGKPTAPTVDRNTDGTGTELATLLPRKIRGWDENDGRAPDTVAALAAAATNQPPPPPPEPPSIPPPTAVIYSPRQLKSYPWDRPNSCFFDNGLELWFRSFSKWSGAEQAGFLGSLPPNSALTTFFFHFQQRLKWIATPSATDIQGTRVLSLGQSHARHLIFNRWQLYKNKDDYGCATTWLHHAIRDSNPSVDVKLHIGVLHIWSGSCPSQYNARVGVGSVQDLLRINLFDLRVARRKRGPATSLTEYFAHCTPRVSPGNDEGGTIVVHSLPQLVCVHPDCAGSQLLELAAIDTLWPKILQINLECGTEPRLPSIPLSSSKSGVLIKQMLRFNHAHTIYDTNFRPPTFRRDEPSY